MRSTELSVWGLAGSMLPVAHTVKSRSTVQTLCQGPLRCDGAHAVDNWCRDILLSSVDGRLLGPATLAPGLVGKLETGRVQPLEARQEEQKQPSSSTSEV